MNSPKTGLSGGNLSSKSATSNQLIDAHSVPTTDKPITDNRLIPQPQACHEAGDLRAADVVVVVAEKRFGHSQVDAGAQAEVDDAGMAEPPQVQFARENPGASG